MNVRYGLLTVAYIGAIGWLSSRPELSGDVPNPVVALASNLLHVPAYAGLTFCLLKTMGERWGERHVRWEIGMLALSGAVGFAALNEWAQSFVPGRQASAGDVVLDLAGIFGMFAFLRRPARRATDG